MVTKLDATIGYQNLLHFKPNCNFHIDKLNYLYLEINPYILMTQNVDQWPLFVYNLTLSILTIHWSLWFIHNIIHCFKQTWIDVHIVCNNKVFFCDIWYKELIILSAFVSLNPLGVGNLHHCNNQICNKQSIQIIWCSCNPIGPQVLGSPKPAPKLKNIMQDMLNPIP